MNKSDFVRKPARHWSPMCWLTAGTSSLLIFFISLDLFSSSYFSFHHCRIQWTRTLRRAREAARTSSLYTSHHTITIMDFFFFLIFQRKLWRNLFGEKKFIDLPHLLHHCFISSLTIHGLSLSPATALSDSAQPIHFSDRQNCFLFIYIYFFAFEIHTYET